MNNFYRIEKELYIDELMAKYKNKLFVLIFSVDSKNFSPDIINNTNLIKKNIKKELLNENNAIFLYINLQKYNITQNNYASQITRDSIPYVSFYYNNNHVARILNAEWPVFIDTYNKIKLELDREKSESPNNTTNSISNNNEAIQDNNDIDDKIELNNIDEYDTLKEQIKQQRKLEEIEKLKQQYLINELTKLKKSKEIQENIESK